MSSEQTQYFVDPVRPFLHTGFIYRGHTVQYDSYVSKYDGCVMTEVIIDGYRYPFHHRTQGSAEQAAKHAIDALEAMSEELQ